MTFQDQSTTGTPTPATPDFSADIPLELAIRAHSGTSHSPERRGESEVSGYAQTLSADFAEFTAHAEKHGNADQLAELFPNYRDAYKRCTLAHLSAKSRCISTMIAGGSNFPVRRAENANATEHRRLEDVLTCRKLWRKRILKAIVPNTDGPIMSGDADAVERLKAEIQDLEAKQARMKGTNAAIRKLPHFTNGRGCQCCQASCLVSRRVLAGRKPPGPPSTAWADLGLDLRFDLRRQRHVSQPWVFPRFNLGGTAGLPGIVKEPAVAQMDPDFIFRNRSDKPCAALLNERFGRPGTADPELDFVARFTDDHLLVGVRQRVLAD